MLENMWEEEQECSDQELPEMPSMPYVPEFPAPLEGLLCL